MSGHLDHNVAAQALKEGAYDFITKPIDGNLFVLSVKRAVEAFQLRGSMNVRNDAILSVAGLPLTCTVWELKTLFAPYGDIRWA